MSPLRSDNNSGKFFIICNSETTAVVSELLFHGRGLFGKAAGSFLSKFRRSGAPVRSTGAEQGADTLELANPHRYRVRSLPATGALIRAEDEGEQMSLL